MSEISELRSQVVDLTEIVAALRGEYLEGKRSAKEIARGTAAFQSTTRDVLAEVKLRTQLTAIEVTESRKELGEVHDQARLTNGRMGKAETRLDLIEAQLEAAKWRWRAFVGLCISVASGLTLLVVGVLLR